MMKFQQLFDSPNNFCQDQWNTILEWFGNDEFNMVVWGTFIITTASFWTIGLSFLIIDLTGNPRFLRRYRIQKTSKYPVKFNEVLRGTKQILFNQFVCGLSVAFIYYHAMMWRGYDSSRNLPVPSRILLELLFFIFLHEIVFYYLHRFFHTPLMYKHIHYLHHQWVSPIAISAVVCHPLEHICVNLFPILLGPFLLGSHLSTAWLWFSIATVVTLISHSGFKIPTFPNPEIHDLHHSKSKRNYGVFGLMDRVHGTN